jgi:hypothetical protein
MSSVFSKVTNFSGAEKEVEVLNCKKAIAFANQEVKPNTPLVQMYVVKLRFRNEVRDMDMNGNQVILEQIIEETYQSYSELKTGKVKVVFEFKEYKDQRTNLPAISVKIREAISSFTSSVKKTA